MNALSQIRERTVSLLLLSSLLGPSVVSGAVVAWGRNDTGQTNVPANLADAVAVAAIDNSMALKRDGTVVAWGLNGAAATNVPAGLTNVVAIVGGTYGQCLAIRADGTVATWVEGGGGGSLGVPSGLSNVVSVAESDAPMNLASKRDGTITAWPYPVPNFPANFPPDLSNSVAVAAGHFWSASLKSDGTIAVGGNDLSPAPAGLSNVIAIAGGRDHILALKRDGTVVAWGDNTYGQTSVPFELANVTAIAAGFYHSLALRSDGTVVAWGRNDFGQATVPAGLANVTAIAGGVYHSLAVVGEGAPFIVAQPVDVATFSGMPAQMAGLAGGALPISYQWRVNTSLIPGATSSAIFFDQCQISNSGTYQLVASNSLGTAVSAKAVLRVFDSAPLMVVVPTNQVAWHGKFVTMSARADGSQPLSYQWSFNGSDLAGATGSSLAFNAVSPGGSGQYSVRASNSFGFVTNQALLTVSQVANWPAPFRPLLTATDTVDVAANAGPGEIALQRNGLVTGINLTWGTNLIIPSAVSNVVAISACYIAYVALRSDGSVVWWGPTGNLQPSPTFTNAVAISGGYTGSADFVAVLLADGTVSTFSGFVPQPGLSNVVAMAAGSGIAALRADGTVAIWDRSTITVQPGLSDAVAVAGYGGSYYAQKQNGTVVGFNGTVPPGIFNPIAIAGSAAGLLSLKQDGTVNWAGQDSPLSDLNTVTAIGGGFNNAAAAGGLAPYLPLLPSGRSVRAGSDALVVARVTGARPMGFQWQFNGTNLPYGTNAFLIVPNIQAGDAGAYSLAAANAFGATTNLVATLSVTPTTPTITLQPSNQTVFQGSTATFNVAARGSSPFTYQWQFYGTNLPGATGASLVITQAQASDHGPYDVVVSNAVGGTVSSNATLTVIIPLASALNTTGLVWTTSGDAPWFGQVLITHDGIAAAQSGHISDNQQSTLQTTVNGPGSLSFWWKVSSEQYFDVMTFSIGGAEQARISGEVDWQQRVFSIGPGSQSLTWLYSKDASNSSGQDSAWLDQVTYAGVPQPVLTQPAMNAGVFSFSVATQNGKTYTLEFKNGLSDPAWAPLYSILGDGTIRTLSDTNAATAQRFYRINQSN